MSDISISPTNIIIGQLPMPPSTNHQYTTFMLRGKIRRVPSQESKTYKKTMEIWTMKNIRQIDLVIKWAMKHQHFKLERFYHFKANRLWTKAQAVRKMDVTNRVKLFDDQLCAILGIEDSQIWASYEEKISIPEIYDECVIARLTAIKPRNQEKLIAALSKGR